MLVSEEEPGRQDEEQGGSGRAMRVARALSGRGAGEFVKPGKLVEIRFVKGGSLSLTASRLLALMILTAGGDAWREQPHRMRKADIRRGHKGNERIDDMLEELHRTLFAEDDKSWRGRKATKRFSLILTSKAEVEEEGGESGWIEWEFTPDARRLIQESESYALLNRQAVLAFRSSYALRLYEMGAIRIHRRQRTWRCDMPALRAALGVPPEVYSDFAQLRRKVLQTAKAEIDHLSHFTVEWRETKQGRSVSEVEFTFIAKDAPTQLETVHELEQHAAGRRARREGTVEQIDVAFSPAQTSPAGAENLSVASSSPSPPRSPAKVALKPAVVIPSAATFPPGSLGYAAPELHAIGLRHGGGWSVDLIASAYREQMGQRLEKLSGVKLRTSWQGFCESFLSRRGPPR